MNISVVFPGQGSQRPGMGQDFYDEFEEARIVFEDASNAIQEDLKQICFTENEKINLTEFTQPAILTTEIAIWKVFQKETKWNGSFFAGHSLGEYSALVAAGALNLKDAVQIVRKRGALMQSAVPLGVGSMAACIYPNILNTKFKEIVESSGAEIANYNSKDQIVISGKKEAIEKASNSLQAEINGIQIVVLTVSAPFHSSLMKPIEEEFGDYLRSFPVQKEKAKAVLSNFTGRFHDPENLISHLVSQISGSVRWVENMEVLIQQKLPIYELGPNRPLGKFFQTLGTEVPSIINVRSLKKIMGDVVKS